MSSWPSICIKITTLKGKKEPPGFFLSDIIACSYVGVNYLNAVAWQDLIWNFSMMCVSLYGRVKDRYNVALNNAYICCFVFFTQWSQVFIDTYSDTDRLLQNPLRRNFVRIYYSASSIIIVQIWYFIVYWKFVISNVISHICYNYILLNHLQSRIDCILNSDI